MVGVHHTVPYLRLAYKGIIMPVSDMGTLTPSTHTTIVTKQVISCRVLTWDKEKFLGSEGGFLSKGRFEMMVSGKLETWNV